MVWDVNHMLCYGPKITNQLKTIETLWRDVLDSTVKHQIKENIFEECRPSQQSSCRELENLSQGAPRLSFSGICHPSVCFRRRAMNLVVTEANSRLDRVMTEWKNNSSKYYDILERKSAKWYLLMMHTDKSIKTEWLKESVSWNNTFSTHSPWHSMDWHVDVLEMWHIVEVIVCHNAKMEMKNQVTSDKSISFFSNVVSLITENVHKVLTWSR